MDTPSCKTCSYYMTAPLPEGAMPAPTGWCRRYPPTVLWIDSPNLRSAEMQPDVHSFMPAVHEDVWCGEYRWKGTGKAKERRRGK